ncbi:MAG: dTDP-4-dehydrorhamnose 3,5-epimerase [Ignavibacteriae bacterium]|nr:dTDP-4-dehydrorhamnose 3,5-epimerase [Ignavibacteriota bacterium]
MTITQTTLPDVLLIEPTKHGDARGFFMETWRDDVFAAAVGRAVRFVQDNASRSVKGTLRGLHYQHPYAQGKLVRVTRGEVYDVAVDIRRGSPYFGAWYGCILSEENTRQLWIPPGFAHGFYVVSDVADFAYKCTEYYHAETDGSVLWNDPDIGIQWPLDGDPLLSRKDTSGLRLADITTLPVWDG